MPSPEKNFGIRNFYVADPEGNPKLDDAQLVLSKELQTYLKGKPEHRLADYS